MACSDIRSLSSYLREGQSPEWDPSRKESKMSAQNARAATGVPRSDRDELLAQYINLLNEKGRQSAEVIAFEKEHHDDPELYKLIKTARDVSALLGEE